MAWAYNKNKPEGVHKFKLPNTCLNHDLSLFLSKWAERRAPVMKEGKQWLIIVYWTQ